MMKYIQESSTGTHSKVSLDTFLLISSAFYSVIVANMHYLNSIASHTAYIIYMIMIKKISHSLSLLPHKNTVQRFHELGFRKKGKLPDYKTVDMPVL